MDFCIWQRPRAEIALKHQKFNREWDHLDKKMGALDSCSAPFMICLNMSDKRGGGYHVHKETQSLSGDPTL